MAIPDHPWTRATKDAAAVRIAMTVAERGDHEGELREVTKEIGLNTDEPKIELARTQARINPDLTVGVHTSSALPLVANTGLSARGVGLFGPGFMVPVSKVRDLGIGTRNGAENHIREYRHGRDLLHGPRQIRVLDLYGLSEKEVRTRFPEIYSHLLATVKPDRDKNPRKTRRENWWLFGEQAPAFREQTKGLGRYIATPVTSKHRIFQFIEGSILADDALVSIGVNEAWVLGVLQSSVHQLWASSLGGTLEDRERYNKSTAFDPFPFPDATPEQRARIAELAEELDATRKAAVAETDKLTMTELYNLREKLRSGAPMDEKEQRRATKARAAIVNRLHEQLDQAVAEAYGWGEEWRAGTLGPSEIVARLVALNHERAAEEKQGKVRWLRPDYQEPRFGRK